MKEHPVEHVLPVQRGNAKLDSLQVCTGLLRVAANGCTRRALANGCSLWRAAYAHIRR